MVVNMSVYLVRAREKRFVGAGKEEEKLFGRERITHCTILSDRIKHGYSEEQQCSSRTVGGAT